MSREIKFRAWIFGGLDEGEKPFYTSVAKMEWEFPAEPSVHWDDHDEWSVYGDYLLEQFTGLKDKNGKPIYEGDVVQIKHPHKSREWTGEVIYEDYRFTGKDFYFPHFDYPSELFSEGTEYIKVIGNCHENPNLLVSENKEE